LNRIVVLYSYIAYTAVTTEFLKMNVL